MGLSINVCILADLAENDPEGLELEDAEFRAINDLVRQHGLPEHEEPKSLPMHQDRSGTTGFPYYFLHYLRRFSARRIVHPDLVPPPRGNGGNGGGNRDIQRSRARMFNYLNRLARSPPASTSEIRWSVFPDTTLVRDRLSKSWQRKWLRGKEGWLARRAALMSYGAAARCAIFLTQSRAGLP